MLTQTNPSPRPFAQSSDRAAARASSSLRYALTGARIALGLIFTVLGLNGFFGFLPQPPVPGDAGMFLGALAATGYMFPLIKGVEVVAGILLLSNRYVPLALTLLAPILVNILAFHLVLAPAGLAVPLLALALELTLAWSLRDVFRPMLAARTTLAAAVVRTAPTTRPAPSAI